MIITPIQFHGHVIRKLSDWCNVVPYFSIDAELPSLDVQLGPGDYSAILSLMNTLSDGRPTIAAADKGEGDGDAKEEKENKGVGKKETDVSPTTKEAAVTLLMKFHMKEV